MKALFVMNPISGSIKKSGIAKLIDAYIDKEKYDYKIMYTERAGHATEIARNASDEGYDVVVAVGGDGTINEVGSGLLHSDTIMALLPCGSGNGLARHLSIPVNIKKSIDIINACNVHDLDYCMVNDHPYFCTCGMGFDAFISQKFAEGKQRGPLKYVESVLLEGLRYHPEVYTIEDESGTHRYSAYLVSCANASQYGNNAYIAPQASMSDGLLDVIVIEPFGFLDAAHVGFDLMNKTLNKSNKVKTFKTKKVLIHRQHEGPIHFGADDDGKGTGDKGGGERYPNDMQCRGREPKPVLAQHDTERDVRTFQRHCRRERQSDTPGPQPSGHEQTVVEKTDEISFFLIILVVR